MCIAAPSSRVIINFFLWNMLNRDFKYRYHNLLTATLLCVLRYLTSSLFEVLHCTSHANSAEVL